MPHRIIWSRYTGRCLHLPMMGGLLHLVQRWEDRAGPQPFQESSRRTKCYSPEPKSHQRPVYQSLYCCTMVRCSAVLMCPLKGLNRVHVIRHKSADCTNSQFAESGTVLWIIANTNMFKFIEKTRSALGRTHLPPTTVFRRFKTTRCCFDGPPILVRAWDFLDVIKFHIAALQCIRYGRKESCSGIRTMIRIGLKS